MTVKELIEELQKHPQNAVVKTYNEWNDVASEVEDDYEWEWVATDEEGPHVRQGQRYTPIKDKPIVYIK